MSCVVCFLDICQKIYLIELISKLVTLEIMSLIILICLTRRLRNLDGFSQKYVDEIGFFFPSELFCNVLKNAHDNENLNETLETIFKNIENSSIGSPSEKCFKGLFKDFDVNSVNLGGTVRKRNENLVKLLNGIAQMNFGDYKDLSTDLLGDAYEHLMAMYAKNGGK